MSTAKIRINISLSDPVHDALAKLARRDRIPQATKATRLLEMALELEEDQVWNTMAKRRDTKSARYFSHDKTWK